MRIKTTSIVTNFIGFACSHFDSWNSTLSTKLATEYNRELNRISKPECVSIKLAFAEKNFLFFFFFQSALAVNYDALLCSNENNFKQQKLF